MKVDIAHRESKKLFGSITGHSVTISVAFSDDEKGVITRCYLGGVIAFTLPPTAKRPEHHHVTINDLLARSWSAEFPDTVTAQDFGALLKEAMRAVKERIVEGGRLQPTPDSFEL
jgi:hypothetical protein